MAIHDASSDASALAVLLGIEEAQLQQAVGGPWSRANEQMSATRHPAGGDGPYPHGDVFVGRAGPSVLLQVIATSKTIRIGTAFGDWAGPATLFWRFEEPRASLRIEHSPEFLKDLKHAVDAAANTKAASLQMCRYCGRLQAPEHMMRNDQCQGCASTTDQVVY